MKALFYPEWETLEVRNDLPVPEAGEGEVLVRVSHCGICGSELETFRNRSLRRTPPLVMGHEFCGYVEKSPAGSKWVPGTPVISHSQTHCGKCALCLRGDTNLCPDREIFGMHRRGAFAEYVAVPERILLPWPEGLPATSAVFAEPLANGINALHQGRPDRKSRVVVIGAGPIGLMCVFAAKQLYGSSVAVADLVPERLEAARLVGADLAVNSKEKNLAEELSKLWGGAQAEFVIDAVGSARTKVLSIELLEPAGMAVWLGLHENRIEFDSYALTLPQKSVSGSYSGSLPDLKRAVDLLATGALDTSWAQKYSLEDSEAGFRNVLTGTGKHIKAIVQCSN